MTVTMSVNVTSEQIRAARALVRLEQSDLAQRARVSIVTIRRLEGAEQSARVSPMTVQSVRRALEQAGAEFIPDGVRRQRSAQGEGQTLYEDLRAISLRSAARLEGHEILTDADLYDQDGLPA